MGRRQKSVILGAGRGCSKPCPSNSNWVQLKFQSVDVDGHAIVIEEIINLLHTVL